MGWLTYILAEAKSEKNPFRGLCGMCVGFHLLNQKFSANGKFKTHCL